MCNFISFFLFLTTFALLSHSRQFSQDNSCVADYQICSPVSATSLKTPQIGDPSIQDLYTDLISSSLPSSDPKASPPVIPQSSSGPSLCCSQYQQCMTLNNILIPFCYSRFTTNFFLPDGSYGTVISGNYTSSSGATANLLTGEYRFKNGTTGNIYAGNEAARPNIATLAIPSQFTGKGVGTVVPASELGKGATTYTTTISGGGQGVRTETVTVSAGTTAQNTPQETSSGQRGTATLTESSTSFAPENTAGGAVSTQSSGAGSACLAKNILRKGFLTLCICTFAVLLST